MAWSRLDTCVDCAATALVCACAHQGGCTPSGAACAAECASSLRGYGFHRDPAGAQVSQGGRREVLEMIIWYCTVGASNFEPLFWLRAWNWCFRLVSMLLYERIRFLNMLCLVDNDYRFVIKCNLRIYMWSCRHTTLKTKRAKSDEFRYYWPRLYDLFSWLEYDILKDAAVCHTCRRAQAIGMETTYHKKDVFTRKNALEANVWFLKHQNSEGHRAAVDSQITVPTTSKDLAVMLDERTTEDRAHNRDMFLRLLRSVRYLLCRGLALRGNFC